MKAREQSADPEEAQSAPDGTDTHAPAPVSLTPLVGRDTEVDLLRDRWEQAQEGMGQVVLLIGEPGLGKSRLVDTIKQIQLEDSAPSSQNAPSVVEWRCAQRFQDTGLFPIADHFRRFLGFGNDETTSARFDRLALHLDECGLGQHDIVALFAKLLFLPSDERYPAASLTPIRERQETFRAVHRWLRACSDRNPILFVIEDLHWIDASTLEFLEQFIAEGMHDRILTLLTLRPEFTPPWPAVAHQTSLTLNRLTRRQVSDVVRKNAGGDLPEELVKQIYHRTRGVPLLVEEFGRMVREAVVVEPARLPTNARDIPTTLQDLVMGRLDRMSSNREVAQMAALLGREFPYEVLAAVVPMDPASLRAELAKLVDAEILCAKGDPAACTYVFKHALLEEALHGSLDEEKRRQFHRRAAEGLEARFPEMAERQPELLAQHFTEAGMAEKAIGFWHQAALRSHERYANAEAITHLTRGLSMLKTLEPSAARDTRELEMLGPLGTAYIASRGYAASEVGPVFVRARALCEQVGNTPQVFAMMWGDFAFHVVRGDFRLCADLAESAIAFGERLNDPGILMEALFLRGLTMLYRGDFAGARQHCAQAIADYDNRTRTAYWTTLIGEDSGVTTRCYLSLAWWYLGFPERALQLSRETVELAREINHPFSLEYALHHAAWLHHDCRLGGLTEAAGDEMIQIATEQGFPFWHASGTVYRGAGMVQLGRLAEGLELLQKGLEAYRATGAGLALPHYLGLLADGFLQAGRFQDAQAALTEALMLAERNDEHFQQAELLRLHGELVLAESDDQAGAESWFQRALDTARRQQSPAWELRATTSLARLWRRKDRGAQAYAILTAAHGAFSEGSGTSDLQEAVALLRDWSNEHMRRDFAAGVKYVRDCIPPPMQGKVDVDWRYIPSSTLGGDTIGFHWIDEDHLALYLVDVTGHGLDSALLSVSISNVLRSGSLPAVDMRQPAQVLEALNETFQGRHHGSKFFTLWYGVYRASTTVLQWAGGGHHASVLLEPEQAEPVLLPSTGPMMGVVSPAHFDAASCIVPAGARLLIFSDGVFEIRRDRSEVWNFAGCVNLLNTLRPWSKNLADELLWRARQLRGSQQLDDDFSVIEVRFT